MQVQTPVGLQFVDGMVVPPTTFSPYITVSEDQARGESLTLRYWREGVDDQNSDGIADETEYKSQNRELSVGLTGEQQVQFMGIDVSSMDNDIIHLYVEGTDWVGLSYQDGLQEGSRFYQFLGIGSRGGGQCRIRRRRSWDRFRRWLNILIDRLTQDSIDYSVPGIEHTFKVRLDEPNGFKTIDNISAFLCGYGSEYGYSPTSHSPLPDEP